MSLSLLKNYIVVVTILSHLFCRLPSVLSKTIVGNFRGHVSLGKRQERSPLDTATLLARKTTFRPSADNTLLHAICKILHNIRSPNAIIAN